MDKSAGVKRVNIFQDLPLSEDTADLGLTGSSEFDSRMVSKVVIFAQLYMMIKIIFAGY